MRIPALTLGVAMLSACASNPSTQTAAKSGAGAPVTAEEACSVAQCIYGLRVVLKHEGGELFDKTFEALPVVQETMVSVYAGATVYFEAEVNNGLLVNLKRVDSVSNPSKTISSSLTQDKDGRMILVTRNPFDKPLRIRMGMWPLAHDRLVKTSSCPVVPGGASYEMWPYPIFQIVLGDLRLLEEGQSMACVE